MAVPLGLLLNALLTVLIVPMILGAATRVGLIRWRGEEGFKRCAPLFPSITLISMYAIIFLIFFMKAGVLVAKWHLVAWLIVPNLVFVVATLVLITWLDRRAGMNYRDHMGIVFGATGKNNGTAIALATAAFSPLVASAAAVLPIFQIVEALMVPLEAGDEPAEISAAVWDLEFALIEHDTIAKAGGRLHDELAEFRDAGVPTHELVVEGDAASTVVREAKEIGADLIVIGRHGRRTIEDLLVGNTANKISKHAPCPVPTICTCTIDGGSRS